MRGRRILKYGYVWIFEEAHYILLTKKQPLPDRKKEKKLNSTK